MSYITGDFVSTMKTNCLIIFSEIIGIYCGSYRKHIKELCGKLQSCFMLLQQVVYVYTLTVIL
jgi:hypothetical protein